MKREFETSLRDRARSARSTAATVRFEIGEIGVELRSGSRAIVREFLGLYEPYLLALEPACRDKNVLAGHRETPEPNLVSVEVRDERRFPWQRGPYALRGESGKGIRLERRFEVLPHLEWLINWEVIQHRNEFLQLHAASLSREGLGLVMPGHTGSGKTTLTAALLARGWSYYCDEFALIHPETLALHPFPRALCIKEPGFEVVDRLALRLERKTPYQKVTKGRVAYLNPLDIRTDIVSRPAPVRWMVFPRYAAGATPTLKPMSPAQAAYEAARQCFNFPVYRGRAVALLAAIVRSAACYQLISGEIEATCDLLDSRLLSTRLRKAG